MTYKHYSIYFTICVIDDRVLNTCMWYFLSW